MNTIKTSKVSLILTPFLTVSLLLGGFSYAFAQSAPSVTTGSADVTSAHNVTLNCSYNSNGSPITGIWFRLGTDSSLNGARKVYANTDCTAGVINLLSGTTYYFQAAVSNTYGTTYGSTNSFTMAGGDSGSYSTGSSSNGSNNGYISNGNYSNYSGGSNTAPNAPLATTNGPASVSSSSVVLNGSINPNNADTKFWFEFGLTQSFGKKTTIEPAGSGNNWQLVTGNLSTLESGRTYYYRVVAQNNYGTALGDTRTFTTTGSSSGTSSSNGSGQVLGSTTSSNGSSSGSASSTGGSSGTTNSTSTGQTSGADNQPNSRPSFISLEYSLDNNGALVLVADDIKPKPGDEFTYTMVYKNESGYTFNESKLRIIIPSEAYYISSNQDPLSISGDTVEFKLGDIKPGEQGAIVVGVKIRDEAVPGTNMIFTSVLSYKDRFGVQLATTSYMTVRIDQLNGSLAASIGGSFLGSTGMLLLLALALLILFSILTYAFVKIKKKNGKKKNGDKDDKKENDAIGMIPSTFEPIESVRSFK